MKFRFLSRHQKDTIHLVMAVSSGGKSTYIEHATDFLERGLPIYLTHEIDDENADQKLSNECVIHYNLFRAFDNTAANLGKDFDADEKLKLLLKYAKRIKVTLLVASRNNIAKRILQRHTGERFLRGHTKNTYPKYDLFELLYRIDLDAFHKQWINLLERHNIPITIINSNDERYEEIENTEDLPKIIYSDNYPEYTTEEMRSIIEEGRFEYQKIRISESLETKGQDRSSSLDLIARHVDFKGRSILDIGCAYGYFCYGAEEMGATNIVGTELKQHRFVGANIIKNFKASQCRFLHQDVFSKEETDAFDIVLFLNVIHHLKEPIFALNRLSRLCREALVMEFPTLMDEKFRATLPNGVELDPDLPLIGVSQLSHQDQMFVFNGSAIKRILMDNAEKLFSSVDIYPSPMSEQRLIAICKKYDTSRDHHNDQMG